jgi:hypothetical protein
MSTGHHVQSVCVHSFLHVQSKRSGLKLHNSIPGILVIRSYCSFSIYPGLAAKNLRLNQTLFSSVSLGPS